MRTAVLIGLGGFIGTILRYILSGLPYKLIDTSFPVGILLVNFIGAFSIGYFMEFSLTRSMFSDTTRMFVAIGVLGGFTTVSTFSYETIALFRSAQYVYGLLNVFLTNVFCLGGTMMGIKLVSILRKGTSL